MAVSKPKPSNLSRGTERQLHICGECGSDLVHPVDWKEADRSSWTVTRRCPNCEWVGSGTYAQELVDSFDEELDVGAHALMRDLRELARSNMSDDVERFVGALKADAILPEDF